MSIIYPVISSYVFSCYTLPSRLLLLGGYKVNLVDGTTQGDPIAMAIYAIAVITLLLMVLETVSNFSNNNVKMAVYADDFIAGGASKV